MNDPQTTGRYQIEIADRQSELDVDHGELERVARAVLDAEQVAAARIGLALVNDAEIQRINRAYLQHDYPTDVISFTLESEPAGPMQTARSAGPRGKDRRIDGELVVSTETAARAAPEYGWSPGSEVILYTVHGMLHLCGYDDRTEAERSLMRRREQDILALWHLVPRYDEDAGKPPH